MQLRRGCCGCLALAVCLPLLWWSVSGILSGNPAGNIERSLEGGSSALRGAAARLDPTVAATMSSTPAASTPIVRASSATPTATTIVRVFVVTPSR